MLIGGREGEREREREREQRKKEYCYWSFPIGHVSWSYYSSWSKVIDTQHIVSINSLILQLLLFHRDLAVRDVNNKIDPYAVINYGGKELSTHVLRKTRFPRWNKTYEIPIKLPLEDPENRTVKITLYDWEKFHQDAFLGEVRKWFWLSASCM